jgi:hypothetical protein
MAGCHESEIGPMSTFIDIDKFSNSIAEATRKCFNDLVASHPEKLYGFALYTVDDLAGIVPSGSAESGYKSRRERVLADDEQVAWLRKNNIDVETSILGDQRWSIYDWEHETHGSEFFADADLMLSEAVASVRNKNESFKQLTGEVFASFTIALHRLRRENLFGDGSASIMLFCSKPSSSDTVWLERESARLLNPSAEFAIFKRERVDWISESGEEDDPEAHQVYKKLTNAHCKS